MDNAKMQGRRQFLAGTTMAAGAAWATSSTTKADTTANVPAISGPDHRRLPREVRVATISMQGIRAANTHDLHQKILRIMDEVAAQQPDIVCLPETFAAANIDGPVPPLSKRADEGIGSTAEPYGNFARQHNCYVVCPIHSRDGDRYYNSALFIGRRGELLGRYHKIHTTTSEMQAGVSPGPIQPPIFETDFGKLGAQICFDIEWSDGWSKLAAAGAEIVFWPSAFAGGRMVNTKAWENQYCVVSSTLKDTSKICDIDGTELARTGRWNQWACATVNLEKEFLHTWPYVRHFGDIQAKYGSRIRIKNHAEEEWSIIESRSPELKIADVMREFKLKNLREHLLEAESMQHARRS